MGGVANERGPVRIKNDVHFLAFRTCLQINSSAAGKGMG